MTTKRVCMDVEEIAVATYGHAAAKRDDGIQRAAEHAGEEWAEWALRMVRLYSALAGGPFLTEDARAFAEWHLLTPPPDLRAWGHVMRLAAKRGYIRKAGYLPAKSSNLSPKVAWVRA